MEPLRTDLSATFTVQANTESNSCSKEMTIDFIGCPTESGTPTPATLITPASDDLGDSSITFPGSFGGSYLDPIGNFSAGIYELTYLGGVWHNTDNPCGWEPAHNTWKFFGVSVYWNNLSNNHLWHQDTCILAASGVDAENVIIAAEETYTFGHTGGTVALQSVYAGTAAVADGSESPGTFNLTRIGVTPTMPARVRIHNYDDADYDLSGCAIPLSVDPDWDGTFGISSLDPIFNIYRWLLNFSASINGFGTIQALLFYATSGNAHSVTGAGFSIEIYYDNFPFPNIIVWKGWRSIGTGPIGYYYRDSGCSSGPDCVLIESY